MSAEPEPPFPEPPSSEPGEAGDGAAHDLLPPGLELVRFRLQYKVAERASFAADKGRLLRRGLVRALRRGDCLIHDAGAPCALQGLPLPFVYTPPTDARTWYYTAESWTAHLVLLGAAREHARCFFRALDHQVRFGWPEAGTARVLLEQVDMLDPRDQQYTSFYFTKERKLKTRPVPYTSSILRARAALLGSRERITLSLASPLHLDAPLPATARAWLGLLRARLEQVEAACGEGAPHPAPRLEDAWDQLSAHIEVDASQLQWLQRGRRWEAVGSVVLSGPLAPLFSALIALQHLHLGHGAALGFGRFELKP